MNNMKNKTFIILLVVLLLAAANAYAASTDYHILKKYHLEEKVVGMLLPWIVQPNGYIYPGAHM